MTTLKTSGQQQKVVSNITRIIGLLAPAILAFVGAFLFVVNDTDTLAIRNGSVQILTNNSPYALIEENGGKSPFTSPPHIVLLGLPFVIAGARISAFWNVFFSLPVVMGQRNSLATIGVKLLFIFTPPFLYMIAAANISGLVTGIGLLLLLRQSKGTWRGLAWAFLLLRPQDSLIFLAIDGIRALRERDIRAFLLCGVILLIPIALTPDVYQRWFYAMYYPIFIESLPGYTLSLAGTHGLIASLGFMLVIFGLRAFKFSADKKIALRKKEDFSLSEIFWLQGVITLVCGPYTTYYMLWLALIILREYNFVRSLVLLIITMVIAVQFMTMPNPPQVQFAMLLLIFIIALISPRQNRDVVAIEKATETL